MKLRAALELSRVSNLPTVWSNVLAGVALAGGAWADARIAPLLAAMSLAYVGGMFLNDAFDREFDARMRPDRPIPAGTATAAEVFGWGFGMLGFALALLLVVGRMPGATPWGAPLGGLVLAGAIVLYDAHHKNNPLSPLIMGLCRVMVYVTAALAMVPVPPPGLYVGATVLLGYLIGLTYAAKNEHLAQPAHMWPLALLALPAAYGLAFAPAQPAVLLPLVLFVVWTVRAVRRLQRRAPGDVPAAVGALLAGISTVDAIVLAGQGQPVLMLAALAAFALTWRLQRWVAGT